VVGRLAGWLGMFGSCLLGLGFHRDPLQVIKIRYKAKRGEEEEEKQFSS
jgi:hypothetical protein